MTFRRLVYVCIKWCRDVMEDLRVNRCESGAQPRAGVQISGVSYTLPVYLNSRS